MKTVEGFILYVDILGYCNILSNIQGERKLKDYLDVFSMVLDKNLLSLTFGVQYDKKKLLIKSFSDNFMYLYQSNKSDYDNYCLMIYFASLIQSAFLKVGILTRGSISFGEVDYNKFIVFGNDLVNVIHLESDCCGPKIVIDPSLIDYFKERNGFCEDQVDIFATHANSVLDYDDYVDGVRKWLELSSKSRMSGNVIEKIVYIIEQLNHYFERELKKKCILSYDGSWSIDILDNEDKNAG